ncbi:MAG: LPS-assembly protein LptD [Bacteroidaceae bacterium]|nr:LPS-assembly protein LptD [Bacteroidaceae bacterium]
MEQPNDTVAPLSGKSHQARSVLSERSKHVADSVGAMAKTTVESLLQDSLSDSTTVIYNDSLPSVSVDSLLNDSAQVAQDKAKTKSSLDAVVDFSAKDSLVFEAGNKAYLYGASVVNYQDIQLDADQIELNLDNSTVYAVGRPDSVGEVVGNPIYKDKDGEYESESMSYNFKTKRGYITNVITEQGEGYLTGGRTKKTEDDILYMENGRYTTCDNHEHPHFYLQLTKAKVRPKKNVVAGPAYMVLEDVPLPLAVPFGFFPFSKKYSSGIIFPTFGEEMNRGFYIRDGGYYFAINDYVDLALTGEIYTKGSWGVKARSAYVKRYKFSGSIDISFINTVTGDKGMPDYSKQNNFRVAWTHTQDPKSSTNSTFSASVNFATSGYTRNNVGSYYNPNQFTQSTSSSSINYTYRVPNAPLSISATANVTQRTQDSTLNVSLPSLTISLSQLRPFKRKNASGPERWYEKIQLSYSGRFQNSITAKQDEIFKKNLLKDWRNGISHNVPISATFSLFKYLNMTASVNLTDRMYFSKVMRDWDPQASAVVNDTVNGFYNVFDFNVGVTLQTKLYGFYTPMKFLGDAVKQIRHVLTPSVSFTYAPDFSDPMWGAYEMLRYTNQQGQYVEQIYSPFQNGIFGTSPKGERGVINLSFANNLEMKVKSSADSTGVKKISLIENLTVGTSYNLAADSLRWSNINVNVLIKLAKGLNLNLRTTWDPYCYQLNSAGNPVRVDVLRSQAGKGWARLSSAGTSFSYTLNNDTFKKKEKRDKPDAEGEVSDSDDPLANSAAADEERTQRRRSGGDKNNNDEYDSDGYYRWKVPWSLTINYSVSYAYGKFNKQKMEYDGRFVQNLSLSGSLKFTKAWSFNFSASYDFDAKKLAYMNCTISRDLHCFTMSASFVPVGPYKSYNFHIAVKSSLLKDLKYDKQSHAYDNLDWY